MGIWLQGGNLSLSVFQVPSEVPLHQCQLLSPPLPRPTPTTARGKCRMDPRQGAKRLPGRQDTVDPLSASHCLCFPLYLLLRFPGLVSLIPPVAVHHSGCWFTCWSMNWRRACSYNKAWNQREIRCIKKWINTGRCFILTANAGKIRVK